MASGKINKKNNNFGLVKMSTETNRLKDSVGALKAKLVRNEAAMNRVLEELKEMRKNLSLLRGNEKIIKLREEVRKELIEIKRAETSIHIDADKTETIYSELNRRFQDIDAFAGSLHEIRKSLEQGANDIEFLKTKIGGLVDKSELDKLTNKVQWHIASLKEINGKSSLQRELIQLKALLEGIE